MSHSEIISRTEALSQGLTFYYTGKKCKAGHVSLRYTSNWDCLECATFREKLRRDSSPSYHPQYVKANRQDIRRNARNYAERNRPKLLAYTKQHRADNPELYRSYAAKRRAAKLQRTPPWADLEAIKTIYANCPEGYHVDHIHPMQGELISGLHVENNLQYLTAEENLRKSNSFTEGNHT